MSTHQKGSLHIFILVLVVITIIGFVFFKPFWQNSLSSQHSSSLLFVNQARSGSLTPVTGTTDMWILSLNDADNQVLWFSDEPNRSTGWISIETYIKSWKSFGFTDQNPPNAAIVVDPKIHGLQDGSLVVSLTDPIYEPKNKTLTFTVTLLNSEPTTGLSSYKNSPNKILPLKLQNPKVFIDNGIGSGAGPGGWGDGVDGN